MNTSLIYTKQHQHQHSFSIQRLIKTNRNNYLYNKYIIHVIKLTFRSNEHGWNGRKITKEKKKQNNSSRGMHAHTEIFTFRVSFHVLLAQKGEQTTPLYARLLFLSINVRGADHLPLC